MIAIDPHKASWTAVAVDNRLQPLAVIRVEVNRDGYRQLRRFAGRWSDAVWAIEGATGLGAALTSRLSADGIDVVDVPAKLARRVRLLSTGHGRKSDPADALSVGIAAHTATRLNTAVIDEAIAALRALTEHRDDLVRARTQRAVLRAQGAAVGGEHGEDLLVGLADDGRLRCGDLILEDLGQRLAGVLRSASSQSIAATSAASLAC